jgi:hypothetical protein
MKIIKYGEGYPKTCTCDDCKSELEYTFKDIKCDRRSGLSDDPLIKYQIVEIDYVECPVCGSTVNINKKVIETIMRERRF